MSKEQAVPIEHVEDFDLKGKGGGLSDDPNSYVTGDARLITANGEVQKLPIPSSDPNDPLNFSFWEKPGIIASCCWFSIMSLALSGGLGAILVTFIEMYAPAESSDRVAWLVTFPSLFIGIGMYRTIVSLVLAAHLIPA